MKSGSLRLSILSPGKTIYDGEISLVTLPGTAGSFTVLPHHAPIVSSLKKGKVIYVAEGVEYTIEIEGGFMEMSNEAVSVCVY